MTDINNIFVFGGKFRNRIENGMNLGRWNLKSNDSPTKRVREVAANVARKSLRGTRIKTKQHKSKPAFLLLLRVPFSLSLSSYLHTSYLCPFSSV